MAMALRVAFLVSLAANGVISAGQSLIYISKAQNLTKVVTCLPLTLGRCLRSFFGSRSIADCRFRSDVFVIIVRAIFARRDLFLALCEAGGDGGTFGLKYGASVKARRIGSIEKRLPSVQRYTHWAWAFRA